MVNKAVQRVGEESKGFMSREPLRTFTWRGGCPSHREKPATLPTLVAPWDLAFTGCISAWLMFHKSTGKAALLSSQRSFWQASVPQSIYNFHITISVWSEPEVQQGA